MKWFLLWSADLYVCSDGRHRGPGGDYQPDREVSDEDDPDLGAAALEDDAVGGDDGAGGSEDGGSMETCPDDDDDEDEPPSGGGEFTSEEMPL